MNDYEFLDALLENDDLRRRFKELFDPMKQKGKFCPGCNRFKTWKFYAKQDRVYCKSCEGKKPERKKWIKVKGMAVERG